MGCTLLNLVPLLRLYLFSKKRTDSLGSTLFLGQLVMSNSVPEVKRVLPPEVSVSSGISHSLVMFHPPLLNLKVSQFPSVSRR